MIPDGKWRRYHSVFNLQEKADEENVTLGTINSLKYYINGPGAGVDIFLDDVSFNYYERDRSWVSQLRNFGSFFLKRLFSRVKVKTIKFIEKSVSVVICSH